MNRSIRQTDGKTVLHTGLSLIDTIAETSTYS